MHMACVHDGPLLQAAAGTRRLAGERPAIARAPRPAANQEMPIETKVLVTFGVTVVLLKVQVTDAPAAMAAAVMV